MRSNSSALIEDFEMWGFSYHERNFKAAAQLPRTMFSQLGRS